MWVLEVRYLGDGRFLMMYLDSDEALFGIFSMFPAPRVSRINRLLGSLLIC